MLCQSKQHEGQQLCAAVHKDPQQHKTTMRLLKYRLLISQFFESHCLKYYKTVRL